MNFQLRVVAALVAVLWLAGCSSTPASNGTGAGAATGDAVNEENTGTVEKTPIESLSDGLDIQTIEGDDYIAIVTDLNFRGTGPRFLGISERLLDREDEIGGALMHAAEQVVRYQEIGAEYSLVSERSGSQSYFVEDIVTAWDKESAADLLDLFTVVAAYRDSRRTYVLVEVDGLGSGTNVSVDDGGRRPAWVDVLPDFDGYIEAVGVARQGTRLKSTLDRADEDALKQIIIQLAGKVTTLEESEVVEQSGAAGSTSSQTTSHQRAAATIQGFDVVARWISPDGRYVYSLALAQQPE